MKVRLKTHGLKAIKPKNVDSLGNPVRVWFNLTGTIRKQCFLSPPDWPRDPQRDPGLRFGAIYKNLIQNNSDLPAIQS